MFAFDVNMSSLSYTVCQSFRFHFFTGWH